MRRKRIQCGVIERAQGRGVVDVGKSVGAHSVGQAMGFLFRSGAAMGSHCQDRI